LFTLSKTAKYEYIVLDVFPCIPLDELLRIIYHATKKGKRRVGRTETITMAEKARLATQAHIRHTKTDYDDLLKRGIDRKTARKLVWPIVLSISKQWGLVNTTAEGRKQDC
jgi:hypothetical protein